MGELEVIRIRDQLLQTMYWMRSEALADAPSVAELARFLTVPADTLSVYVERVAADGYLEPCNQAFQLTASAEETRKQTFAEEFADRWRATHGECEEDCWCHEDPGETARRLEERTSRAR